MATLLRYATRLPGAKGHCRPLMLPESCLASTSTLTSTLGSRQHPFSSWDYELPWSSAKSDKSSKRLVQRVQESRREHQQKVDLQDALMILVEGYLQTNHKEAFSIQSASQFWKKETEAIDSSKKKGNDSKDSAQQGRLQKNRKTIAIHDALIELTKLNGFKPVDLPREQVPLAEGVVVRPQYHKEEKYRDRVRIKASPLMWARSELKTGQSPLTFSSSVMSSAQPRRDDLPELVEEDIKLYRIIEKSVDDFVNAKVQALQTSVRALETKIQDAVSSVVPSLRRQDAASKKSKKDELDDASNVESPESLLFLDRNEIIWVTNMDNRELRLLALQDHHSYGLKLSSWLISISLVVFGAMPLAYRSYNFTYDYPGLSQSVAASVVLTISYGIWSTQSMAVTRQSQVVSNAVAHRIYARNNAVLWALQQGAVERVSDALLTYYFYCQNDTRQRLRLRPSSTSKPLLAVTQPSGGKQESDDPMLPSTSIDVVALAKEIGLVQEEATSSSGNSKRVAVPIESAIAAAQDYHKKIQR
ncbi:unnamed protein product [Cylindrotheca closterium]|uniref:Uncharacterized protein n=1 Tax=Cylindrotheca closterium TaxID=2856 RepID=A0AAD2FRS8_9STRA|nr:unnamed protein product [Cylindrotheca closterium]